MTACEGTFSNIRNSKKTSLPKIKRPIQNINELNNLCEEIFSFFEEKDKHLITKIKTYQSYTKPTQKIYHLNKYNKTKLSISFILS